MASGTLVYVVGASGVGKDTVLAGLRRAAGPHEHIAIARRFITRPGGADGENHIAVSDAEFDALQYVGRLALCWESHGMRYGVGREIETWLANGLTVLVNGSRAFWPKVQARFPQARLVEITASEATLRSRLEQRGRESEAAREARLMRHRLLQGHATPHHRIANEGRVDQAVRALLDWLRSLQSVHGGGADLPAYSSTRSSPTKPNWID